MKHGYAVIYERGPRNWSTGKTLAKVRRRMEEAIPFHIEGLKLNGDPVPKPPSEVFDPKPTSLAPLDSVESRSCRAYLNC